MLSTKGSFSGEKFPNIMSKSSLDTSKVIKSLDHFGFGVPTLKKS